MFLLIFFFILLHFFPFLYSCSYPLFFYLIVFPSLSFLIHVLYLIFSSFSYYFHSISFPSLLIHFSLIFAMPPDGRNFNDWFQKYKKKRRNWTTLPSVVDYILPHFSPVHFFFFLFRFFNGRMLNEHLSSPCCLVVSGLDHHLFLILYTHSSYFFIYISVHLIFNYTYLLLLFLHLYINPNFIYFFSFLIPLFALHDASSLISSFYLYIPVK